MSRDDDLTALLERAERWRKVEAAWALVALATVAYCVTVLFI